MATALVLAMFVGCAGKTEAPEKGPNVTLSGSVADASSGKSIPGATVADDGYGPKPFKGATTDEAGKYSYMTWSEEHNVTATAPGYKPQLLTLNIRQTGKERTLDFALTRE